MPQKLKIVYYVEADAAALAARAAQRFVELTEQAVAARGRARIAISGGSTPKATFALMGDPAQPWRARMPWDRIDLWWVDERCVPPDNPDSNYRMTREALLDHVPLAPSQIHRMEGELEPEKAAARYEAELRSSLPARGRRSSRASMFCSSEWGRMDTLRLFFPTLRPCTRRAAWSWPTKWKG